MALKSGYVVHFTLDAQTAAKKDRNKYSNKGVGGKSEAILTFVTQIIDDLRKKQKRRIKKQPRKSKQRPEELTGGDLEELNSQFIIAMDNYFTLQQPIEIKQSKDIGIFGTACFCQNWPAKEINSSLKTHRSKTFIGLLTHLGL